MGNGIRKLKLCFSGEVGEISGRDYNNAILNLPHHLKDDGLGHSFCYIRQEPPFFQDSTTTTTSTNSNPVTLFRTISGASISANSATPLSINILDYYAFSEPPSTFESSPSFSSVPLQPIPPGSVASLQSGPIPPGLVTSVRSSPISRAPLLGSGSIERRFASGPLERNFASLYLDIQSDQHQRYIPKSNKWDCITSLRNVFSMSGRVTVADDVQWAQGKAGEDRVHVVVSEEHDYVFVGIYDGFNGPDATDFLLKNLYSNVYKELKEFLCNNKLETDEKLKNLGTNGVVDIDQFDVLKALSEALRKTEASYLEMADMMINENPELALMGSCVLVMLLTGKDIYLMNVGDSRAVLAQKPESDNSTLGKIYGESLNSFDLPNHNVTSFQLTMDHNTSVKEEILRIKSEHPGDASAIKNGRVKGSLKVTRAFGAGYLKEPKWNDALLGVFKVKFIGNAPYINCLPALYHHKLGPTDKYLILSSDGLYQYLTNEEAVSEVAAYMSIIPEGDPSQHLVEEVLFRAAQKAGMDFHELLDIPPGERRRYHDDVTVVIISFEGKIWRSSV